MAGRHLRFGRARLLALGLALLVLATTGVGSVSTILPESTGATSNGPLAAAPPDETTTTTGAPESDPEPIDPYGLRVRGATPDDARVVSGETGRSTAPNFSASHGGPTPPPAVSDEVWWVWTAPADGEFEFNTHGSDVDTVLEVYGGEDVDSLSLMASNDDFGDVVTSAVTIDAAAGETYHIHVVAKNGDAGLIELGWNHVQTEPLELPQAAQSPVLDKGLFSAIPISTNTGEKPQSKVWQHGDSWWAVLASTSVSPQGVWLWQLAQDGKWSNVLHLSSSTNLRADAKVVGDVTHIFLHGPSSRLVSIEYDTATGTYRPWSQRPTATQVSLPGSETATIDIDSTGRMWLATDAAPNVHVYYSDPPYNSFSGPVTLASNIASDDIAAVTAISGNKIGVMWSNQNTRRFGFRTHADGTSPTSWTPDEVPAGASALNVGNGMADDHLNLATTSDGTLYAAVKTSYNNPNRTVIGLLVRRPNGTWDPLYEVERFGTRPIVLVNESDQTVRVLYTEEEQPDDILMKVSPLANIDFGDEIEVMDGDYNNVTSTKDAWSGEAVVMASTSTQAFHAVLKPEPAPGQPVVRDMSVVTVEGESVDGVFEVVSSSGGELTFEVVSGPSLGEVVVTDPVAGGFTYTPAAGAVGSDGFTYRVGEGGLWSEPATVSVTIMPRSGLLGSWSFEEGSGSVVGDGSGLGNDGVVHGSPDWVERAGGLALELNGSSEYVTVADDPSLDVSGPLTLAAWVRPDRVTTQYVVKKAAVHSVDGFEIGLSSSGTVFGRFNQASSGNSYRVESTKKHPADGVTWMHVAVVYDGSTIRLFLDGVEEASGPGPSSLAVNDLALAFGAEPDGNRALRGALDEVKIFGRALSASEIAELAAVPVEPVAPVAGDVSVVTVEGESVDGVFEVVSSSGGELTFEVVSGPSLGEVVVTDPVAGGFTYTPAAGAVGSDGFTYRVGEGGLWSEPATVSVTIMPRSGLLGSWSFEEGSGSVVGDGSGLGNDGVVHGSPDWVERAGGLALELNGSSEYVTVADDPSLDVSGPLTLAAWVRPDRVTTQYVVKKAAVHSVDGFEIGLSSSGTVFGRFNQASSGNSYRVESTKKHPADGVTWMHVAVVYDGSTIRLFLDGVEEASGPGPSSLAVNDLALAFGAEPDGNRALRGALDEVKIFGRALSASEIAELAAVPVEPVAPVAGDVSVVTVEGESVDGVFEVVSSSGGELTFEVVSGPSLGEVVVTDPVAGGFTYTPAAGAVGSDGFTYRVGEGGLWSEPATVSVTIMPDLSVPAVAPVAGDVSVVTVEGESVDGVFEVVSSSGGELTFEVVSGPSLGEVVVTDPVAGGFTYTPAAGAVGSDGFTYRVGEGGLWSEPATVSVTIMPRSGLLGSWSFEEGSGSVVGDGSGLGNDGVVHGSPDWVERAGGLALELNGSSEYVTVADDPSLDVSGPLTLAAWVRPDRVTTQYVVKKAAVHSVDGFEIGLSSSGTVFGRFNQASSGNSYRVESTKKHPADGVTWMHVAVVYDGSTIRLFLDGVEEASGPGPSSLAVNDLALAFGAEPDGNRALRGALDEVKIFGRALSASEIAALAK